MRMRGSMRGTVRRQRRGLSLRLEGAGLAVGWAVEVEVEVAAWMDRGAEALAAAAVRAAETEEAQAVTAAAVVGRERVKAVARAVAA